MACSRRFASSRALRVRMRNTHPIQVVLSVQTGEYARLGREAIIATDPGEAVRIIS